MNKGATMRIIAIFGLALLPTFAWAGTGDPGHKHKTFSAGRPGSLEEMEQDDPSGKRLAPQTSSDIIWKFTKNGTFEFACLIPGHYQAGMRGSARPRGDRIIRVTPQDSLATLFICLT